MSSEFASHIGMKGTCFCRICHVRGADVKNRRDLPEDVAARERLDDFTKVCAIINSNSSIIFTVMVNNLYFSLAHCVLKSIL